MGRKVVIIAYTFPPAKGIGGRRWAKFAKFLVRLGVDVKVISFSDGSGSSWTEDIKEFENQIIKLVPKQPYYIKHPAPRSIIGKVRYKLSLKSMQNSHDANIYDPAIGLKHQLILELEKLIEVGYLNIIVTGAPFYLTYYTSQIKNKYRNVNLIMDYRDPWTTNKMGYQYKDMSKERLEAEQRIEKETISKADFVYTVNDTMSNYFRTIVPDGVPVKTILNGYDTDDASKVMSKKNLVKKKLRLIYTGNLYDKLDYVFNPLVAYVKDLLDEERNEVEFNFYGTFEPRYKELIEKEGLSHVFKFHGTISLSEVYQKIHEHDVAMLFLTKDLKDSFSTKYYEYLSQYKYIAIFGEEGAACGFVEKHKIGVGITPEIIKEKLEFLLRMKRNHKLVFNKEFKIEQYSVESIAKEIFKDLK